MDTRTGELKPWDALQPKERPYYVKVARGLTKTERGSMKIGRNSLCGCGSGKKFKRCCLVGAVARKEGA